MWVSGNLGPLSLSGPRPYKPKPGYAAATELSRSLDLGGFLETDSPAPGLTCLSPFECGLTFYPWCLWRENTGDVGEVKERRLDGNTT